MKSIILTLLFSVYISLIACGSAESNIEPLEIFDIEAVMLEGAKEMLQARMDSLSEEDLNATLDAGMGPESTVYKIDKILSNDKIMVKKDQYGYRVNFLATMTIGGQAAPQQNITAIFIQDDGKWVAQ